MLTFLRMGQAARAENRPIGLYVMWHCLFCGRSGRRKETDVIVTFGKVDVDDLADESRAGDLRELVLYGRQRRR